MAKDYSFLQDSIDYKAKLYYQADIRVAQGEDPEKVARDLGLDNLKTGGYMKTVWGDIWPLEQMIGNKLEEDGRTTLQHLMTEGPEKQFYENALYNVEKANEKLKVVKEKKKNLFIVFGCVIGLFFLIGSKD